MSFTENLISTTVSQDTKSSTKKYAEGNFGTNFRLEAIAITLLFVVFLLLNIVTASRYVSLWHDEVWFTDPAANLYLGHGFTSTAWPFQTKEEFWAGNAPLYSIVLSLWMQLFGFSIVAVRSLNYFLMVIAGLLLWPAVIRLNLLTSNWSRVALIALFLLGEGLCYSYRTGRYDCLQMILVAGSLLIFSIPVPWLRCVLLALGGILWPMAGLQFVAYAIIFSSLLLIYLRRSFVKEALSIASGFIVGAIFLSILYYTNGVGIKFILATMASQESITGQLGQAVMQGDYKGLSRFAQLPSVFVQDTSFFLLLCLALVLAIYQIFKGSFRGRSILGFGLATSCAIPVGMFILSKFSIYYSWMAFVPLAICVLATLNAENFQLKRKSGLAIAVVLVVVCSVGLPWRLSAIASEWDARDYAQVEHLVESNVTKNDWVFCDLNAYYPAKKKAAVVILPTYTGSRLFKAIPEREKISVMIVNPSRFEEHKTKVGGEWHEVGDGLNTAINEYKLKVFRRNNTL